MENIIEKKSFDFAVAIIETYKKILKDKHEHILSKQLLRCGTSIGANVAEAERAQSKADFKAKMFIALKEANETIYWLRLLKSTGYVNDIDYNGLYMAVDEIVSILVAITKNA